MRTERHDRAVRVLRVSIARAQARLATALGVSRLRRKETVIAMLDSNARRAPGYWLQLLLATGIATLGLALNSTAVVIGGMLVSPLMGPILELGMGFAVGSSLLVIRAFLRVLLSAAGVVALAALMTLLLPFHEINPEIAARTAPTLLDLLVAVFCALAAAYTTVRQTADTTAAAAGTAIGIALVPPLCVVGYGIGTRSAAITSGSALLFTANFSAIVLLSVISFLVLGYNQVDASSFEHDYLEARGTRTDRLAERAHLALRSVFGSRYGLAMRVLIPAFALALVALPLKRALDEVAWEVRVRDGIRRVVDKESPRAVQSALTVERNTVGLRLLVVGSPERATELERTLTVRIASIAGVTPNVSVTAVPDATMLGSTIAAEAHTPTAPPRIELVDLQRYVADALDAAWPTPAVGRLVGWSLELTATNEPQVTVWHLGPPLGAAGEAMLGRSLAIPLNSSIRVADIAMPATPVVASSVNDSAWLRSTLAWLDQVPKVDSLYACVHRPPERSRRGASISATAEPAMRASAAGRADRLVMQLGQAWAISFSIGRCPEQKPS